jgi:uncharacterized protein YutE (UPF0331/DUF86 family)
MVDDVVLNKIASTERCLARIQEEYAAGAIDLEHDHTRQDAIVLNLLRACEASIDLAMHQVRVHRLGIPQTSREAFDLLRGAGFISEDLAERLKRVVSFRDIAVRNYQAMSLQILRAIIEHRLGDFTEFSTILLRKKDTT